MVISVGVIAVRNFIQANEVTRIFYFRAGLSLPTPAWSIVLIF